MGNLSIEIFYNYRLQLKNKSMGNLNSNRTFRNRNFRFTSYELLEKNTSFKYHTVII